MIRIVPFAEAREANVATAFDDLRHRTDEPRHAGHIEEELALVERVVPVRAVLHGAEWKDQ
ncbi:MAG: hypothetical protein AB199_03695 [Parcubacteria bacterium C7867-004]|nr:MAG: hypothetical protein AB199_03695 [Parcubacteria bacterium C7867-004]